MITSDSRAYNVHSVRTLCIVSAPNIGYQYPSVCVCVRIRAPYGVKQIHLDTNTLARIRCERRALFVGKR